MKNGDRTISVSVTVQEHGMRFHYKFWGKSTANIKRKWKKMLHVVNLCVADFFIFLLFKAGIPALNDEKYVYL